MGWKTYSFAGIIWILALGGTFQGFETSSMAVFIGSSQFNSYFNNPGSLDQGMIAGAHPLGAFIGCWIAGLLSEIFGRVSAMQSGAFLWIIGSIVSILVQNLYMVIAGRGIKGIAVGIFNSTLPVYIAEVIPARRKASASSIMQWCLTWGIMIMFYLSFGCSKIQSDMSFRVAWGIETTPGALFFILAFLLPESPKWYASNSRWEKASEVIRKLQGATVITWPAMAENQNENTEAKSSPSDSNLRNIEGVLDRFEGGAERCSYADLFKKGLRTHLIIGVITQATTQLTGIGVLMYYLIFICEMVGLTGDVKVWSASIQYVINVAFTIFPIIWLSKMRRKDVMVYGAASLGICIGSIGLVMGYYGRGVPPINGNESAVWEVTGTPGSLCLALCFLFVAIFASTLSCAAWLYTSEIFPSRAKSKGSALCMSVSWTLNFALTFLAPISLKYLKWGTFCVFGAFCIIGAIIIGISFPETYGLSDDQISSLFKATRVADMEIEPQQEEPSKKNTPDRDGISLRDLQRSTTAETKRNIKMVQTDRTSLLPPSSQTFSPLQNSPQRSVERDTLRRAVSLRSLNRVESVQKQDQVSPFLKKFGAPFESESSSAAPAGLTGGDEVVSTKGSEHYYNFHANESPFLSFYEDSAIGDDH